MSPHSMRSAVDGGLDHRSVPRGGLVSPSVDFASPTPCRRAAEVEVRTIPRGPAKNASILHRRASHIGRSGPVDESPL